MVPARLGEREGVTEIKGRKGKKRMDKRKGRYWGEGCTLS